MAGALGTRGSRASVAVPCVQDLSSLTRDPTLIPALGILNCWTTGSPSRRFLLSSCSCPFHQFWCRHIDVCKRRQEGPGQACLPVNSYCTMPLSGRHSDFREACKNTSATPNSSRSSPCLLQPPAPFSGSQMLKEPSQAR